MNRKIQKYSIKEVGHNYTDLPSDAFYLNMYTKDQIIYVTFLIDVDAPKHKRDFYLAKSNEILTEEHEFDYRGSTVLNGEPVFLFEQRN